MNKRPQLSIVTVNRNSGTALWKTWSSLVNQSFTDWEWVVVDGVSSDGSASFLSDVKSEKLKFISEKDTGIYNAMNKGIPMASGEYLYFLNAGDTLAHNNALKEVMPQIHGVGIFYCDVVLHSPSSTLVRYYPNELTPRFWIGFHLCHQAALFHRDVFQGGGYDETRKFAADYEFFARAYKQDGRKFTHIKSVLANYDLGGVSAAQKNRAKVLAEIRSISEKYFGNFITMCFGTLEMYPDSKTLHARNFLLYGLKFFTRLKSFLFRPPQFCVDLYTLPRPDQFSKPDLKVLHLSSYQDSGGASVAAMRLHTGLTRKNISSMFVTLTPDSFRPGATQIGLRTGVRKISFRLKLFWEKFLFKFGRIPKLGHISLNLASPMDNFAFESILNSYEPDIVHIHWIGHNFLPLETLQKINKPIVWSFHDMWPFLCVDHVDPETPSDDSFKNYLTKKRGIINVDEWMYHRKEKVYGAIAPRTTAICPSQWMMEKSLRSPLVQAFNKTVIPNMVVTADFFPIDKLLAREALGISKNAKILLFGAFGPFVETNKGFHDFIKVMEFLKRENPEQEMVMLTFGSSFGYRTMEGVTHKHFDWIKSTEFLRLVYSAADMTVVASVIESFCLVAAESMACGTPVVCYDTSGLKDVVDHKVSGYRAKLSDVEDLISGVSWVYADAEVYQNTQRAGIHKVKSSFDEMIVTEKHIELYRDMLKPGLLR